jgi:hypothetical protein
VHRWPARACQTAALASQGKAGGSMPFAQQQGWHRTPCSALIWNERQSTNRIHMVQINCISQAMQLLQRMRRLHHSEGRFVVTNWIRSSVFVLYEDYF